MTNAQIYALFINPLLILTFFFGFVALLMRSDRRNAKRIVAMETERAAADAAMPRSRDPRDIAPSPEHSLAK